MAIHVRNNFCIAPFTQLTFGPDGIYSPCPEIGGRAWKDVSASPVAMWSSAEYNALRESFSNNEKNPICNRCWDQESHKNQSLRKRLLVKPGKGNMRSFLDGAYLLGPKQFNIITGNKCNLRCRICRASSSVTYNAEGAHYEKAIGTRTIYTSDLKKPVEFSQDQINEMVRLSSNLERIEFYGGEPLLDVPTLSLLESLIQSGRSKDISLFYNTNGTVMPSDRHFELWNQFKNIEFNFSIDDIGERFTYNRYPGKWDELLATVDALKNYPWAVPVELLSICTVGALNVYYLPEILDEVDRLQLKCFINHVNGPEYYDIRHLPQSVKIAIINKLSNYHNQSRIQFVLNMLASSENLRIWEQFKFWTKQKDTYRKESLAAVCPEYYKVLKEYDKQI